LFHQVTFLELLFQIRGERLYLAAEQPASSWGFKQVFFKALA
jgi:hypothetical protein